MSSIEGQSDRASAAGARRFLAARPRLLPVAGAILLAFSPFVTWARLELHGVYERGDGTRRDLSEVAGDLNLVRDGDVERILTDLGRNPIATGRFRSPRDLLCGLLYATSIYSIKEFFSLYPQLRAGLFVALAGSAALFADGIWIGFRHRRSERTLAPQ